MSETFLAVVNGDEREQWNSYTLADQIDVIAMTGSNSRLAGLTVSVFHISNGTARKVWQGTPADARAGRGYITEEPAPEIPPCKYPVGTVIRLGDWSPCQKPTTVTAAKLSWVYSYVHPSHGDEAEAAETQLDRHYVVVPPDPYQPETMHLCDFGALGARTVKVIERKDNWLTARCIAYDFTFGVLVAEFEKAVVK
jgi:hypothetical protein